MCSGRARCTESFWRGAWFTADMRPVIGVTPDEGLTDQRPGRPSRPRYELKRAYTEAISAAGGVPIVLPYLEEASAIDQLVGLIDGLVVTGGAFDVPPDEYGAAPHPRLGPLNPGRTRFERLILEAALAAGRPVLGVCGGMQLLNVLRGGTLIQDIASEHPDAGLHEQPHDPREVSHSVAVERGTLLARLCGATIQVNTTHHQAIGRVGRGLVISARAPDGIVEAIEDPSAPFVLGVQWHPELLQDQASRALHEAFVASAARTP